MGKVILSAAMVVMGKSFVTVNGAPLTWFVLKT
jgi:hypothetical protein